ncbi:MAG: rhamnulokinase [Trueperaceae bacterium]|nr:rhamnulokinase [Trueperaceae bacterium]
MRRGLELGPASVGVDAWGVDFGLLDARGRLLANPVHYRDSRTDGLLDVLFERIARAGVFSATGIQFMPINTSVQLLSQTLGHDPLLAAASKLLLIPDLMHMWFCGSQVSEYTNATTTQLYDQAANGWSGTMLSAIGIDAALMPEVVAPGTTIGEYEGLSVIAPATHDTASAVAAVPARNTDFAYVSSGTWSLVGLELEGPRTGPDALSANVTNEGGVAGTTRLLKNVMGLWVLQQCATRWGAIDYREVVRAACEAPPLRATVDVDHPDFLHHGDHVETLQRHCRRRGGAVPESLGEVARAVFESLAFAYRRALERVETVAGRTASVVHLVGGGARNALLCQLTAEATGRPVVAGPAEATALGNAGVQLLGLGHLGSLTELRDHVRRAVRLRHHQPLGPRWAWEDAYARWCDANSVDAAREDR